MCDMILKMKAAKLEINNARLTKKKLKMRVKLDTKEIINGDKS